MSHYKSNVRDQEFNLFEVLGVDKALGRRQVRRTRRRHGPRDAHRDRPAGRGARRRIVRRRRPQPAGVRPRDSLGRAAGVLQEVGPRRASTPAGTRSASTRNSAACRCRRALRVGAARSTCWAPTPRSRCTRAAPASPRSSTSLGTEEQKKWASAGRRARLGLDHGAHRAGRRFGRRRRPHQGRQAGGRLLAHRRREALHHLRRLRRHRSRTSSTWCWPAPRAPDRAPRVCRCSSCRSSCSTPRPASPASATASSSPTSSTRWA